MLVQPCDTSVCPWDATDQGAAWMNCPLQVSRIVQYTSSLYPPGALTGMPPVPSDESKVSLVRRVMITMTPEDDSWPVRPRLAGIFLVALPSWYTVSVWVLSSVTISNECGVIEASTVMSL